MKRDYKDGINENIKFFIGIEIENTPARGLKTLFVVGVQPTTDIVKLYKEHNCEHVYIGANQSFTLIFNSTNNVAWKNWEDMITELLDQDILVTLDFDLVYANTVQSSNLCKYNNFIPQISVKIPYISKFNYNTTLKIDDIDFNATNQGVWCHRLHNLQNTEKFTSWYEYRKDTII